MPQSQLRRNPDSRGILRRNQQQDETVTLQRQGNAPPQQPQMLTRNATGNAPVNRNTAPQQPQMLRRPAILTRNASDAGIQQGTAPKRVLLKRRDPNSAESSPLPGSAAMYVPLQQQESNVAPVTPGPVSVSQQELSAPTSLPPQQPEIQTAEILKHLHQITQPIHISLIDANGNFQTSNYHSLLNTLHKYATITFTGKTHASGCIEKKEELRELYNDAPFRVIGVLGRSNSGKSTLIEKFGEIIEGEEGKVKASSSQDTTTTEAPKKRSYVSSRFKNATPRTDASYDTTPNQSTGVTVHVFHRKRVIFLEAQSLFSISKTDDLVSTSDASLLNAPENRTELLHFQLGALLFNSCHAIIFVEDQLHQKDAFEFTKTIRMIQKSIPNAASKQPTIQTLGGKLTGLSAASDAPNTDFIKYSVQEYIPEICFVFNKVDETQMHSEVIRRVQHQLDKYFAHTKFNKNGHVRSGGDSLVQQQQSVSSLHFSTQHSTQQEHVNHYMLPRLSNATYHPSCSTLLSQLLTMPIPAWPCSLREKEWLESVKQVWDVARTSHFLAEYFRSYCSV